MPTLRQDAMIVTGGVVLIVLAAWYAKNKVTGIGAGVVDSAAGFTRDVEGVFNDGVNGIGAWFSGNPNWTYWHKPEDDYVLDPKNVEGW